MSEPKAKPHHPTTAVAHGAAQHTAAHDSTHYVVLHHLNAWEPGEVIEASALPVVDNQPAEIQRLLDLRAMRPASEEEAKLRQELLAQRASRVVSEEEEKAKYRVRVGLWEGRAPRAGAKLVISRADVEAMRERIRNLETHQGNPEELRSLRERVKELEGIATADKGASVPAAKGKPGE